MNNRKTNSFSYRVCQRITVVRQAQLLIRFIVQSILKNSGTSSVLGIVLVDEKRKVVVASIRIYSLRQALAGELARQFCVSRNDGGGNKIKDLKIEDL